MPTTPQLQLPYPTGADAADVPTDLYDLADRIDDVAGAPNGLARLDATGKVPTSQIPAGGSELGYVELTGAVTIAVGTVAAPTDVLSLPSITYDGTTILLEFFAPRVVLSTSASRAMYLHLWDASTNLGQLAVYQTAPGWIGPVLLRRRLTPSAGAHTYRIRGHSLTDATLIQGGIGGAGVDLAAYLRATRA